MARSVTGANDSAKNVPPLRPLLPAVVASGVYAVAALVWIAFGDVLPGGRWVPVHLFTAGVLSNMIVALTHHFAQTLLHTPGRTVRHGRFALLNVGAVLLVAALLLDMPRAFAVGATMLTAAVLWLYVDLRRLRKRSLTGRFTFVVRGYERACGAFVHGAILGALMGVGLFSGGWYGAARLAHLHANVLGWGGLTLLATVVFFGPTVMRTRMENGADAAAMPALRVATTGLTIDALALLLTGGGSVWVLPARLVAAGGLAAYAAGATAVCLPVLRAARRARPSPQAWSLRSACTWMVAAVWADVLVVATGRLRLLDALGAILLVGVLGQAILGAVGYLTPMIKGSGPSGRAVIRQRLDGLPRARLVMLNLGVGLVVIAVWIGDIAGIAGSVLARVGWVLVAVAVLTQLLLMATKSRSPAAT